MGPNGSGVILGGALPEARLRLPGSFSESRMKTSICVHHWELRGRRGKLRKKLGIKKGAQNGEEHSEGIWGLGQGVQERGLRKKAPELEEGLGGGGDSGRQRSRCHQRWGSEEEGI